MSSNQEISSFIWNVCDDVLRGLFKQHEYGDVILPFVVLRRLDCVLDGKKDEIIKVHQEYKDKFDDTSKIINSKLNLKFSNFSRYDLNRLKDEPNKLTENFYDYLSSFSTNVQDIIQNFGIQKHIDKLNSNDKLYILIEKFTDIDLHPDVVDNHVMGNIFEELLRKFSEMSNETSGEHYTPRDIVRLLVSLVFSPDKDKLSQPDKIVSVYDPCCGTGGMLTIGKDWVHENINPKLDINLFGQELNPQTYSICKSDFLITDEEPDNIKLGSTLTKDQHNERGFDYMITNPPFGVSWKSEEKQIINESLELGGRFTVGTPRVSDGSLLFLQHLISKMETQGSRIGIVFNGSPLFTGDGGSGESDIRRWIIENDLLECVVQLPDSIFFNTSQTTYVWILNNNKSSIRKGKVQLIDGSGQFKQLKKLLGIKRKEVSDEQREFILKTYVDFKETEISKIYSNRDFGFTKVTIEQPLIVNGEIVKDKSGKIKPDPLRRDFEKISLDEDIQEYFEREVKPNLTDSWIDLEKNKIGYEINFGKYFFITPPPRKTESIIKELLELELESENLLNQILNQKVDRDVILKDSGVDWIGEIPENWSLVKTKYFTKSEKNKSEYGEEELLSVSEYHGVIPRRNIREGEEHLSRSESLEGYLKVKKDQLVSNIMLMWKRGLGVSDFEGIVSPSYSVFSFINSFPKYFHYLFRTDQYVSEFRRNSTGVIESRLRLYDDSFGSIKSHFPPNEEQVKIVEFLDNKTELIDKQISIEERRIELMKEYRKSLISEVVTGKIKVID
jgi:type I restriction enzyme M protein